MSSIVLVGFMGTGKSVVGRLLAQRLKRPFLDLDRQIEKECGKPIPRIFAEDGEAAFRRMEAEAVRKIAALRQHVIATGGGIMTDEENVRALKSAGAVVCLTASPDVILKRTAPTVAGRPMLAGGDPRQRIEELLQLRAPFYAKADFTVDTTDRSVEEIVQEIMERTGNG